VIEQQFKSAGVEIVYVLGEYPDTPEGTLNKNIKAVIAEYERLKIRERMIRGRNNVAQSGKVIASDRIPYGYRLSDDRTTFVIWPDEAKVVNLIFEFYTQERVGLRKIAKRLTELKIPTAADKHKTIRKKRKASHWSPSTVSKILKNKTYTGVWTYNKTSKSKISRSAEINVPVPAIISKKTYRLAQERLAENGKYFRTETKYDFTLNRRCKCAFCESRAVARANNNGRYLYYRCAAMHESGRAYTCNKHKKAFNARKVDEMIWQWLRSLLQDEEAIRQALLEARDRQTAAATPLINRLSTVNSLISQYEKDLTKALDNLDAMDKQDSKRAKAKILKSISQIETTLDSLEAERTKLQSQIEAQQTLTDEAIESIQRFALKIGRGLAKADDSIELRREAMETFDVQVILTVEDDKQVFYGSCMLQLEPERFDMDSGIVTIVPGDWRSGNGRNRRRPG